MQIHMHKTMREALDRINICQTRREVVLIFKKQKKKKKKNQDIDAFWGEDTTAH